MPWRYILTVVQRDHVKPGLIKTLFDAFNPGTFRSLTGGSVEIDGKLPSGVPSPDTEDMRGLLRASQVNAIVRLHPALMLVNPVNAAMLLGVLYLDGQVTPTAQIWTAGVLLLAAWSWLKAWPNRSRPAPERTSRRTVMRLVRSAGLFGAVWSVPGLLIVPAVENFSLGFAMALLTGMIAGGGFALYPIPAAALAFMAPVTLSSVAGLCLGHGWLGIAPAIIATMFLVVFMAAVRRHAEQFVTEFLVRIELERRTRLIEDILEDARLELLGSRKLQERRLSEAKKIEAVGLLAGGIAHDFNNLLTAVRGNAELQMLQDTTDAELLRAIIDASDRGAQQVSRLLSVARKQALKPEPVPLAALLSDLRRILEPALGTRHAIDIHIEDGTHAPVADAAQLENSLINLVFNARDAMPDGGTIRIACRNAPSPGARHSDGGGVEIAIQDTGHGMDEDTRTRATDPFFSTKGVGAGSGLGLSCVAGFTAQSGGDLNVISTPGKGTTVRLVLPAATTEVGNSAAAPARPHPVIRGSILVVEDTDDVRDYTCRALRHLGFDVHAVAKADDALAWLAAGHPVDLLLTDILLSGSKSGLLLAREARKRHPDLAVAFMSAWSAEQIGQDLGNSLLLHKPFTTDELDAHVAGALSALQPADPS